MDASLTVSALFLYPIKSTRGISLRSALLEERGLQWDRRWMLVDVDGRQVTQREHPKLCLVDVKLEAEGLRVGSPGLRDCWVPFVPQGGPLTAFLWKVPYEALQATPDADAWFSDYLGEPVRLAFMPDTTERWMNPNVGTARVGFADGNPIHLITEASVADLSERLREQVPVERFRPNVVVRGAVPFAEDGWRSVRIGETALDLVEATFRCGVLNVDPARGVMTGQPLRALAGYRQRGRHVEFGQNLVVKHGGRVSVGDRVMPGDT